MLVAILMQIAGGFIGIALGVAIFFPEHIRAIYRDWKSK